MMPAGEFKKVKPKLTKTTLMLSLKKFAVFTLNRTKFVSVTMLMQRKVQQSLSNYQDKEGVRRETNS